MGLRKALLVFVSCIVLSYNAQAQCGALVDGVTLDFLTDKACAPVTVTQFDITYYFYFPQVPADITIVYEWNDPANTVTVIGDGSGLIVGSSVQGANTTFRANSTFTYTSNFGNCRLNPTVSLFIGGVQCPTTVVSRQPAFWSTDNQANGIVSMTPVNWDVCFDNPIVGATFTDNSDFNCNINVEPTVPNRLERHVQFVYGTNHNPGATIRNLTLTDGGPQPLTDATGNLVSPSTRGTAGLQVTAGYFGPIDNVPFPADGPTSVSFPMNAPADVNNLVNNVFEVTMFNWNVCNPWNGSTVAPNYDQAIITTGYIRIVPAPSASFFTRDGNNVNTDQFCIGETIFFRNNTGNIANYTYTWEFFDDAAGTILIGTANTRFTTFAYPTGGTKLVRLTATSPTAQSPCVNSTTHPVFITPALVANIGITDLANIPITPDFCQEASPPLTNFNVRFTDISTGVATATTGRRWEFYDENNTLVAQFPGGGAYSTGPPIGPLDRIFTNVGVYRVRLFVRDNVTLCESQDEVQVRVFQKPVPDFTFDRVCLGTPTTFLDNSTVNPVGGEQIISWEWDMSYDGVTFNSDPSLLDEVSFSYTFPTAAIHHVALQVTTQGGCSVILDQYATVDPVPTSSISASVNSGCSVLTVNFTNNSIVGQPDVILQYSWEIDAGSGYQIDSVQRPTDPGFGPTFVKDFENTGFTNQNFLVRLRVITINGCEALSAPVLITVNPAPKPGFVALNYSPFNSNCSPVTVNFGVDGVTQSLNPTNYLWTVSDANGPLEPPISTGTNPAFNYTFVNNTQANKDFSVNLSAMLPSGCSEDSTKTIRVAPVPTSAFTIDTVLYECERMIIHMDATQKGLQEYAWSIFVNGLPLYSSTTDGDNFDYEIARVVSLNQTVEVRLQTTNFANCMSSVASQSIVVPQTNSLNTSFTATPAVQTLPNATVTITYTPTAGPFTYLWDFGDGTTSNVPTPGSHTYTTYGNYTISLTVSDMDCIKSQVTTVTINPIPPILDFDYAPAFGCAPLTVFFTNLSQYADPSSYFWQFGTNQGSSRAVNPTYTYFEPGIYSVTLTATNVLGDTVSITKSMIIEVFTSPTAAFAVYPQVLNIPGDILYTNNRSFGASSYIWDFGDGTTSTEVEPTHKYTEEGVFDIQLIASNGDGCADTTKVTSAVQTIKSGQLLIPNAFTPNLSGPGSTNLSENEMFLPLMRNVVKFQMYVFNRWGQMMFESSNPDLGWDGYFHGKLCQQDVYIYKIVVEYDDGKTITKTGDINLIR